ncbi:3-5 exonuclease family protein [Stylonychia lemnae]|uniref:3-5 exonuclease family protein n=1 Tax=Stylonychia lemnae TaxID=5949 RepID=A0A077ZUF3_STYLE|nr:3-5 exonuclease family protein [Stylonychia lemnae]|eukprot:CDW73502.1 3-5 exonuclease family protein [Stylonychia lemnae]
MVDKLDYNEINQMVKEYLKFHGLEQTLELFQTEERTKYYNNKGSKSHQLNIVPQDIDHLQRFPGLYHLYTEDKLAEGNVSKNEEEYKMLSKQHSSVLQSARQIFSIAINCLQQLHNIKDGNSMTENLGETIDNYNIQLGKYNQILSSEGKCDRSELFSEAVMNEHKTKLNQAKQENNYKSIVEVLLSLRVNALQISPELRKNLVYELIRNDVFLLTARTKNQFLMELLDIKHKGLRHSLLALISVIVSTLKGVEYLVTNDQLIIARIIDILKEQEDGSVNQRFCVAILQKISIKEDTIAVFLEQGLIEWILSLIERSTSKEVHIFSLDFSSALLANMLHATTTHEYLIKNASKTKSLMIRILDLLKKKIPTSVLMHLLICLSYLNKEKFSQQAEQCGFADCISEFVEYYSKIPVIENENGEIDKRTVLDLCAHMFHPKDVSNDLSQTLEYNDMKPDDKIREFENEQGDLIFECFQDEEKMFE